MHGDWYCPMALEVQEPWLSCIVNGTKTVEGRVGPAGKVYDVSCCVDPSGERRVPIRVTQIVHYETLEEYLIGEGWRACAPHAQSLAEAEACYRAVRHLEGGNFVQTFSDARIAARGGMNALRLQLLVE